MLIRLQHGTKSEVATGALALMKFQTQEPSRYSMSLFEGLVPTRLLDVKIPVRLATTLVNMAKKGEVCMESK